MNVYRIEVKVWATMYVKAKTKDEARKKVEGYDVSEVWFAPGLGEVEVSDLCSTDPALPVVSMSPVGTLHVGKMKTVEEVV